MTLVTRSDAAEIAAADFEALHRRADRILISEYRIGNSFDMGETMRSDVICSCAARSPDLVGHVALAVASGDYEGADNAIRRVFEAMATIDPQLFRPAPDRPTFIRLLRRMTTALGAEAHAGRSGPVEARREAYQLHHKFADEGVPEDRLVKEGARAIPKIVPNDLRATRHAVALALNQPDNDPDIQSDNPPKE